MAEKKAPATSAEITPAQIAAWKKEHGRVYVFESEGKKCYLRKPTRAIIAGAHVLGGNDGLKINETMIKSCWLGGDTELKDDDKYFLSLAGQLGIMIEVAEGELKEA